MKIVPNITDLLEIMRALRHPQTGCPWDIEQDFISIVPYTIEEAYEVADAIRRNDLDDLCEELGDLLLQVVYHARLAEEQQAFSFDDVVKVIVQKMRRRHPHVFGSEEERAGGMKPDQWQQIKQEEREAKRSDHLEKGLDISIASFLDDISPALPPILEAVKLAKKAATIGFDWEEAGSIFAKLEEELMELKLAIIAEDQNQIDAEYGDVLFTILNLARKLEIDPQVALGRTNLKFRQRFSFIEKELHKKGKQLDESSLAEMETLWQQAKTIVS